jgi:hypothetical protein
MSRKGLCRRKRVVGFGVHNCCLSSAHLTQRIRRKGRSSDSVHIGLCAVRSAPVAPSRHYYPRCCILLIEKLVRVGTRFLLRVTSNLGPYCILGLYITPLIRCIIDFPLFLLSNFCTFFFISNERRRDLLDHDHDR